MIRGNEMTYSSMAAFLADIDHLTENLEAVAVEHENKIIIIVQKNLSN